MIDKVISITWGTKKRICLIHYLRTQKWDCFAAIKKYLQWQITQKLQVTILCFQEWDQQQYIYMQYTYSKIAKQQNDKTAKQQGGTDITSMKRY